jgi:hypothetical protein
LLVGGGKGPADGGDVGQASEPEQAFHHGVVTVEAEVSELAIAEQQVNDEEQDDEVVAEDRDHAEVSEARVQALLEVELGKQLLEEDQTREGGQLLILETEDGQRVGFTVDSCSARFHVGWSPLDWEFLFFGKNNITSRRTTLPAFRARDIRSRRFSSRAIGALARSHTP